MVKFQNQADSYIKKQAIDHFLFLNFKSKSTTLEFHPKSLFEQLLLPPIDHKIYVNYAIDNHIDAVSPKSRFEQLLPHFEFLRVARTP